MQPIKKFGLSGILYKRLLDTSFVVDFATKKQRDHWQEDPSLSVFLKFYMKLREISLLRIYEIPWNENMYVLVAKVNFNFIVQKDDENSTRWIIILMTKKKSHKRDNAVGKLLFLGH